MEIWLALREVADQNLRRSVKVIGDDVQIPVQVQVKYDRGSGSDSTADNDTAGSARGEVVRFILDGTVEFKPWRCRPVITPRLNSQDEFGITKSPSFFVEKDGVDVITKWVIHTGCDEHILKTIGIEIASADSPRPVCLRIHVNRDVLVLAVFAARIERITEDACRGGLVVSQVGSRRDSISGRSPLFRRTIDVLIELPHVRMHVGDKQIH